MGRTFPWCFLALLGCGGGGGGNSSADAANPFFGGAGGVGGGGASMPADQGAAPYDAGPIQDRTPPPPDRPASDAGPLTPDAASNCPEAGPCESPCELDTDCPGTRACVEGACPESDPCFSPEDCDAPRVCAASRCTSPCEQDADCDAGLVCDPESQGCVTPAECVEDAECPGTRVCVDGRCPEPATCFGPDDCDPGRACRDGTCEAACGAAAPCPGLLVCDEETSLCQEGEGCAAPSDCLGGRVCDAGLCADACVDDQSCPGTRRCDLATGLCPEPAECFVPQDCDADRLCHTGRCTDACNEVAPCPGRQQCDLMNGICMEPEVCVDDADCRNGICDSGQCRAPCNVDADCGGRLTCDAATGHCQGAARCEGDADCAGLDVCAPNGACIRPECETNDDCAGACVDRQCAEAAPVACGPAASCPIGLVCAPEGACAQDGPCGGDADCPAGAPVCDAFDGRCAGCLTESDCAAAELCLGGACTLSRPCIANADCPGDRTCVGGLCMATAACAGDAFDRDPAAARLVARTYTGLVLCDGDEDVYDLSVAAGEGVRVLVRHDPAVGALSATLVDPTAMPPLVLRTERPEGLQIVGVGDAPGARALTLRITGRPGRAVPYSLTVERLAAGLCAPDALEGALGNNDAAHAAPVGQGETEVELCGGDEDWLSLDLPAGVHVSLHGVTLSAGETVEMVLTGPGGGRIGRVVADDRGATLEADIASGGAHVLQLRGAEANTRTRLRLAVDLRSTTEEAACADTDRLVPGEALTLPLRLSARRFTLGCGVSTDPDALLEFTLPSRARVDLTSTGGVVLAVRSRCADPASEVACDASPQPAVRALELDAGTYFAILKVAGAVRPTVTLHVSALCNVDADCGAGGLCLAGACQDPCRADADCPGRQTCDRASGRCREPAACRADEDCLGGRHCRFDGVCFEPTCVENADCPVACVDETCADGPPAACEADADCAGQQVCAPIGACAASGPCGEDVDCPAGTPVCDLDAQACVVCLADGDCGRGETCMADACQFMGACAGPEDCPATRTCGNDGLCRPAPGCPGDRLDGLDPPATLAARTYTGLLLCDGTQDRYIVQPNPGEALRVTLRHDPALGDLALDLSALPPLLERFGSSDTRFGVEIVILPAADPIRPALVTVSGRPGAHVPYSLTVERTAADACAPDALEGPLGNDSLETAARLPPGPQTLSLCEGDEDWLAFRASAGTHLDARVSPADVLLSLVDAGGRVLADGMPGGAQNTLAGDFQIPTDAFLRLRSPDAEARRRVDLQVDATAAPGAERLACDHVLALQPGALLAPPDTLRVQRFTVSCAFPFPGFTGDFVARFSLAAAARVTLAPSDGAAVALRSDCDDPGTELLCGLSGAPALTDIALAAGTYYVVVQAFSPTPPQVRMTVR